MCAFSAVRGPDRCARLACAGRTQSLALSRLVARGDGGRRDVKSASVVTFRDAAAASTDEAARASVQGRAGARVRTLDFIAAI
jgi:hypothetical protein